MYVCTHAVCVCVCVPAGTRVCIPKLALRRLQCQPSSSQYTCNQNPLLARPDDAHMDPSTQEERQEKQEFGAKSGLHNMRFRTTKTLPFIREEGKQTKEEVLSP